MSSTVATRASQPSARTEVTLSSRPLPTPAVVVCESHTLLGVRPLWEHCSDVSVLYRLRRLRQPISTAELRDFSGATSFACLNVWAYDVDDRGRPSGWGGFRRPEQVAGAIAARVAVRSHYAGGEP